MSTSIIKWVGRCLVLLAFSGALYSCNKTFDKLPDNALDYSEVYRDVNDADAAIFGIYGQLIGLSKQYIILNELRGDLMDVTDRSDKYLKQLNQETSSQDNPYADPRPFYKVIMNCNDALYNFKLMLKTNRLTQADFDLRYSAVGAIRSWIYFQLGIQYGKIPYVTDPLADVNAVKNQANYPRIEFPALLDTLANFTESLPYKHPFPAGASLVTSIDGYSTEKFFVPIDCFLGDLYLWKGDYTEAARHYHFMMNYADYLYPSMNSEQFYETYKIAYTGNIENDNWKNIFAQPYGERYSNYEIMWDLPFDDNFAPGNPFIQLFYNQPNGYLLKPSQLIVDRWDHQIRTDSTPGDFRGEGASYKLVAGQPVVNKFSSNFDPLSPFEKSDKWILYRAATLHFHYSECAIMDGRTTLAYGLMNKGIRTAFNPLELSGSDDVTDWEQSFGAPYDFDARQGDYPYYRGHWYRNTGINQRVSVPSEIIDSAKYYDTTVLPRQFLTAASEDSLKNDMMDDLLGYSAMELAFEGNRWPDLLRVAMRREKHKPGSGVAFLQEKISAKFKAGGRPDLAASVSGRLANPKNWFLPFNWD
ncbi:RagB/SusD family nutrient uptake outer membrane protein [Arachidicoccus terrestris]|uniref:RagB/SusD family nutrient uptake outer membrane protein n=1 Tax=Arachidicoccus terrestris TaxID=2875539 RepID=UPI001CC4A2C8|nr:RagB/SusD family nutrient uptake outer membrane protein [Arachidicoccus terrestris]UAY53810.1 RagB/SusD family nutrient uptake outer membrane protein [Arachidicoccus terrestris]